MAGGKTFRTAEALGFGRGVLSIILDYDFSYFIIFNSLFAPAPAAELCGVPSVAHCRFFDIPTHGVLHSPQFGPMNIVFWVVSPINCQRSHAVKAP